MQPTANFLDQAQELIHDFFLSYHNEMLAKAGNISQEIKSDNTPVTALDKQLESELKVKLFNFDSGIGFEGEEFGKNNDTGTYWLVDPIDGTESFVRGYPFVRHMVALIHDGRPIYSYIYKTLTDELFTAREGQGAHKNGAKLQGSSRPLKRNWVELSVPLKSPEAWPLVAEVDKVIGGYRRIGDFTSIAEGKIDALLVYKSSGGDWDYAPRSLLLKEAGLRVQNIGSDTYDFKNHDFVAANPHVFNELNDVINSALGNS